MSQLVEDRIKSLETSIKKLEDFLINNAHLLSLKSYKDIEQKVKDIKRELRIRKDFPIEKKLR